MKALFSLLALAACFAAANDASAAKRTLRCERGEVYMQAYAKVKGGLITLYIDVNSMDATEGNGVWLKHSGRYELCLDQSNDYENIIRAAKRLR